MFRIALNDSTIPLEEHSSLKGSRFTYERDPNTQTKTTYSSTIRFFGNTANYIRAILIDSPNAYANSIKAQVFDDCCEPVVYVGQINSKTIEWCEVECAIKATIIERKDTIDNYQCVDKTFIWDNRLGFQQQQHPFVRHCVEVRPESVHLLSLYGTIVVMTMLVMMLPVLIAVAVLGFILGIIVIILSTLLLGGLLGGPGDLASLIESIITVFQFWGQAVQSMAEQLVSCGKGHPAPYLRNYIKNACDICGLTFQSSILNSSTSAYYNTMLYSSPVTKGTQDYITFSSDDKPIFTLRRLLELLKDTFNGDYRIINNTLTFERRDYFSQGGVWFQIIDVKQNTPEIIELCYQFNKDKEPAAARFAYEEDTIDNLAGEAKWRYDDLVDYDPILNNSNLQGLKEYIIPFGRSRFRYDGITEDIIKNTKIGLSIFLAISAGALAGATALAITTGGALNPILAASASLITLINTAVALAQNKEGTYQSNLLLSQDQTAPERLLIHDTSTPLNDARVVKIPFNKPGASEQYYHYNIPFWFSAGNDSTESEKIHITPNMYTRFWDINDPRIRNFRNIEFTLKIKRDCNILSTFSFDKKIILPGNKNAFVSKLEVTYNYIEINGTIS